MDTRKAFLLRISGDLWKELEAWAADDLRSVNGQIEYLLRQAVKQRKHTVTSLPAVPGSTPGTSPPLPGET